MTHVLITGATGFVGSRLARRLLENGARVRSIVRRPAADPALLHANYEEVIGDFVDPGLAARAVVGCDLVIHAAATAGPELEPVRRVNVDGTRALLDAALASGARRFIQISTLSVYEVDHLDLVDEESPLKTGADPYGATKAEGDRLVFEAFAKGLGATILRPGAILGVHPTSTWAVKVPARVRDRQVRLLRDGANTLPFVHVEDLADAVFRAVENDCSLGRAYNVVGESRTWRDYTDEVRRWFATPPLDVVPEAEAAGMTYWTGRFSADRLAADLGWGPTRGFARGMEEAEAYWRDKGAMSPLENP